MGLSYHFSLRAPASTPAGELAAFLREVEVEAQALGFTPTTVVDGAFDTPERRDFARRVARGLTVEDPRLRGVSPAEETCWSVHPEAGLCRVAPRYGVLLVLTDSRGIETVFGFYRFPEAIVARDGRTVMDLPQDWTSRDSLRTHDPRYRAIIARFRAAGFLESEHDEFGPSARASLSAV
jgi:hypothetical protein